MKVPEYGGPQVAMQGGFNGQISGGDSRAGAIGAQQISNLGNSMSQAGGEMGKVAMDMQQMINQTRENDAANQLREVMLKNTYDPASGYLSLKGKAALDPDEQGQSMPDRYISKLEETVGSLSSQLGNEAQRRSFELKANEMLTSFHGNMQQHMLGEFVNYRKSVQDGTIDLSANTAKLAWNNPEKIALSIEAIKAAVYEKGRLSGWAATQIDAAILKTTSAVHKDVVMAALENNNPQYALGYLDKNKGSMEADDILRVQGQVNQSVWSNQALGAVQKAGQSMSTQFMPNDFSRMIDITAQAESGNKDFNAKGEILTSPAGAKGRMQVMDKTKANPGYGVVPAKDNSPEELARVGRDYLQAMLQRYGNPDKAWAAYNGGPGKLDSAIKSAGPGGDWLAHMPAETQNYVKNNVANLDSGGGARPRPTELDFVNSALGQLPPGANPQAIKLTRDQAVQQFNLINKSLNQQGENAVRQAQQWLAQNNGKFVQLPVSIRSAVIQTAPEKMSALASYAKAFDGTETTTNLAVYNQLTSNPRALANMPDSEFEKSRTSLSPSDFKHFATIRQDLISGKTNLSSESIDMSALNDIVDSRLTAIGIRVKMPSSEIAGNERVGAIRQYVTGSVQNIQQQFGKKLTPQELTAHVDKLFAQEVKYIQHGILSDTTSYEKLLKANINDISEENIKKIKEGLKVAGIGNPTNTDILNAYFKGKSKK